MSAQRMRRVNEALRHVLAEGVEELADPAIGFITVTSVKATSDLAQAEVFVTVLGGERRRQRPKSPAKQADVYSGKKKTHCDKNVVLVQAKTKRVGFLSQTYVGKTHDKKIVDTEPIAYPPDTILYKDTGFQGYEPVVAQTYQPKKSPGRAPSRRPRSGRTAPSPACASGSNMPWRG